MGLSSFPRTRCRFKSSPLFKSTFLLWQKMIKLFVTRLLTFSLLLSKCRNFWKREFSSWDHSLSLSLSLIHSLTQNKYLVLCQKTTSPDALTLPPLWRTLHLLPPSQARAFKQRSEIRPSRNRSKKRSK